MEQEDIIIVGAGPGGVAAAVQCRRLGLSVRLIDETGEAGGLVACAYCVENYPGVAPQSGKSFAALLCAHLKRFDVGVQRARVTGVLQSADSFSVCTDKGAFLSHTIVIAVGTKPMPLGIAGAEHVRYSPLDVRIERERSVAIIGGGEAALDYALSLASAGIASTVIVRGNRLKARGRLADTAYRNEHIHMVFNADPVEVVMEREDEIAVRFKDAFVPSVRAHYVLAAIGRSSRASEILKELDLGLSQTVSTALPGLFIIGDARTGTLGQVGTAVGDGLFAAMQAALYIEAKKGR